MRAAYIIIIRRIKRTFFCNLHSDNINILKKFRFIRLANIYCVCVKTNQYKNHYFLFMKCKIVSVEAFDVAFLNYPFNVWFNTREHSHHRNIAWIVPFLKYRNTDFEICCGIPIGFVHLCMLILCMSMWSFHKTYTRVGVRGCAVCNWMFILLRSLCVCAFTFSWLHAKFTVKYRENRCADFARAPNADLIVLTFTCTQLCWLQMPHSLIISNSFYPEFAFRAISSTCSSVVGCGLWHAHVHRAPELYAAPSDLLLTYSKVSTMPAHI